MARRAAAVATVDVTAEGFGAASHDRPPRLRLGMGQGLLRQIGRAVGAQDVGQAHAVGHARLQRIEQFQR